MPVSQGRPAFASCGRSILSDRSSDLGIEQLGQLSSMTATVSGLATGASHITQSLNASRQENQLMERNILFTLDGLGRRMAHLMSGVHQGQSRHEEEVRNLVCRRALL